MQQQFLSANSNFPLHHRELLHTSELTQAEHLLDCLVDPLRHSPENRATEIDIRLTGVTLDKFKMFGIYYGAPVLVRSKPLQACHILLPLQGEVRAKVNSEFVRAGYGEAIVYSAGDSAHAHWSDRCVALAIVIPKEVLNEIFMRYFPTISSMPVLIPKIALTNESGHQFANLLSCLCADSNGVGNNNSTISISVGLQELLLLSLLQVNEHVFLQHQKRAGTRRRQAGVDRAVDYINQNITRTVSARELSGAAFLSLRSLQIGFEEYFGIGPMCYAKNMRLTKARADLVSRSVQLTSISELANYYGFENTATFRRLYKQRYGELPSETLQRHCRFTINKNILPIERGGRRF